MNAYLLELLMYLFHLCFNQCNASLHFGSSKHSSNFQTPTLPHLILSVAYHVFYCSVKLLFLNIQVGES